VGSSTFWLAPQLTAAFDPEQPGIGEVVVLKALVLWREVGIAGAPAIDAIAAELTRR
jgi:hypothetical protein